MTPLEISSLRAIYLSDCVFNLTMPKWYIKEKLNKGTTFSTIIENRTKRNAYFTKIHVLDISLGLKLQELKVHTHVASKNIKKLTDISFLQACLSRLSAQIMIILVEKALIIFAHAVIINSYWMRSSRIWGIIKITQTEALIIPHFLREPNSIIVLLFICICEPFRWRSHLYFLTFGKRSIN